MINEETVVYTYSMKNGTLRFLHFHHSLGVLLMMLLLLLLLQGSNGLLPEASQEGSLHSFKSYSDVTTFHYTVPKEVLRATWQFAAFMDGKNCIPRKVHIYLQWGSYPIISANNATFPSRMNWKSRNTLRLSTMTTYDAKSTAVVPVNSPEPGDWFVGAHMSHWDEKVQQQGLGHKCRYSIGSVAIWVQTNGIRTIPIGYQKTMRTVQSSTYYKIFIPSGSWQFTVTISDCKPHYRSINNGTVLCMRGLALQGRTLPIFNHTHTSTMANLSTGSEYTFTESSPYEDNYYYLLIVSDTVLTFNVKVITYECPVKITAGTFLRPQSAIGNASLRVNGSSDVQKPLFDLSDNYGTTTPPDSCFRRFQLVRVKQLQTFSGVYLFQGREWLTPWIMLIDSSPVIVQFDVLPLIDVGGTLDITVHLETDKLLTKQLVTTRVCVRRARVPNRMKGEIICDDENMELNLSSYDKRSSNLLIPYPQPDTWFIAMQAKCSVDGIPVNCDTTEILISLDVHTRQCVFSGPRSCGNHGLCQEIHKGPLHYTTCNCFGGYRGWGCTDATDVNPRVSLFLSSFALTCSNAFFLPAIYIAGKRRLYTESLVYLATMLFSSLYHACDQQSTTHCVAKYEVLQYSDFFSSILAVWVTLVAMAQLPIQLGSIFHMFGVLMISFAVESDRTGLPSILVPLAVGVTIPIGASTYRYYKLRRWRWPANLWKLLTGLGLAGSGLVLFVSVETESNYDYIHSIWHMLIALSLVFLLPLVQSTPLGPLNGSCGSGSDSEMIDYKDAPSTPVFTIVSANEYLPIGLG